jgi:type I restriction enzyme M protein
VPGRREARAAETAYVIDRVTGRIVTAGPEEVDATQPLLEILIEEAGWNPKQIVTRPQWRVVASPSGNRAWPVDVAIFDDPSNLRDPAHIQIICECKRPDLDSGIEQLKVYLDREPHARVGVWFNGTQHAVVYKTGQGYEVASPGTPIPTPKDPLVPLGTKVLTYMDLRQAPSLAPVFRRIRDRLATADQNVNRDEEILPDISLLLLLKILDEQRHRFQAAKPLEFQIDETSFKTAKRIKNMLDNEVKRNQELFGAPGRDVRFQVDDDSIYYVVETLQNYRVLSNDSDAVSHAFQVIRGKAYKGEEGQFFTPQSVVAVAIAAVDPRPEDRVIDPACGSGSFLATALANVVLVLEGVYGSDESGRNLAKRDWSTSQLYALDKDAVSVRLSKAYLSMLGDGSTHVYKADSIRTRQWSRTLGATVQDGSFDVVVTNPPFGTRLKVPADVGRQERYVVSQAWVHKSAAWTTSGIHIARDIGLVFAERCIRLLAENGRLAIVLPDTYLFSDTYGWFVQWLGQFKITHSINVPIEAFEPFCRAKTTIIVLEKRPAPPGHRVLGSVCTTFGEDKHGRPRYKFGPEGMTKDRDDEMQESTSLIRSGTVPENRLLFSFSQKEALDRGVLVASYWWRKPQTAALEQFAEERDCDLVSVGDLIDAGELQVMDGHGSPNSHLTGRGPVPYVKVVDIKNWRIIENPSYGIPADTADHLRKGRYLRSWDIVSPTRASRNIGLFGVVMPWQTNVVLTREIAIWRVLPSARLLTPSLLLALMSLRVVHDQFDYLVLMQMNREDLGKRFREVVLPVPRTAEARSSWAEPVREFLEAQAAARESYTKLGETLDPALFADRP